jgi:hypothetical protein
LSPSYRSTLAPSLLLLPPASTHSDRLQQRQQLSRRQRCFGAKMVVFRHSREGNDDDCVHTDELGLKDELGIDPLTADTDALELVEDDGAEDGYAFETLFSVSPHIYDEVEDDADVALFFRPTTYDDRNEEDHLKVSTKRILDLDFLPLGSLSECDLLAITGLMAAWARRSSVEGAVTVELLLKRIVDDMRAGNREVGTNCRMYNIAIDAWARIGDQDKLHCERAQQIHEGMVQMYRETRDPNMRPNTVSFNALLKAWARLSGPLAAEQSERILQQMLDNQDFDTVQPDAKTFSTILDLYGRVGTEEYTAKAEVLFESMTKLGIQRDVICYSAFQNVYAWSGRVDAPEKSMSILQTMLDLADKGDVFARPTRINYDSVLFAFSRVPSYESAVRAAEMLRKMELPVSEGGYEVDPSSLSYSLAILTCARCPKHVLGADLAESLLERMEQRAKLEKQRRDEISSAAPPMVSMHIECFNVVLTALSKCDHPSACSRIIKIITRMENDYAAAGQEHLRPSTRSWNAALNSLSRKPTIQMAQRAEKIVEQMFKIHADGVPNVKPNKFSYAAVLKAYLLLGTSESARRADDIVSHMEQLFEAGFLDDPPDVYHYTIVCSAFASSRSARGPRRCLEILSEMKAKHKSGRTNVKPTTRTYNAVLDCLSRSPQAQRAEELLFHMISLARNGDENAKPDAHSFDAVIKGYVRSNLRDAGKRAESILERGLEYAEEENGPMLKMCSFNSILAFYESQKNAVDAPYRAEDILNRLISLFISGHAHLSPHISCFTHVMMAYTEQYNRNAGESAERLLRTMIKLKNNHGATTLDVNTGVMNRVLMAWAASSHRNADAPTRAERLLDLMEQKARKGDTSMAPNRRSYYAVMDAWSKSSASEKAFRAFEILNRIKQMQREGFLEEQPPISHLVLVLNACAFSTSSNLEQDLKILDIAYDVMTELMQSSPGDRKEPSSRAFCWFIQAFERLRAPKSVKEERLQHIFSKCCEFGRLDAHILKRLKAATSDGMFERLVLGHVDENTTIVKTDSREQSWTLKQRIGLSNFHTNCFGHSSQTKAINRRIPVKSSP